MRESYVRRETLNNMYKLEYDYMTTHLQYYSDNGIWGHQPKDYSGTTKEGGRATSNRGS
ncbi:hypothetical protein BDR07DRAFT_1406466, partial [Suillus spraguei]